MVGGAITVGEIEVVSLLDTVGVLGTYAELFPNAPAEAWAPWRERHPELFDGDSWQLPFRSFLLRTPGTTTLVDTGVGPAGGGEWMPERQGRLIAELERAGTTPDDVDLVFSTHIHVDHVGWNHAFRRARLILHRASWELAEEQSDREFVRTNVLDLAERVEVVEGETEVAPGVIAFETPGHLAGHMSLTVGDELVLLADVAPHPAQLTDPDYVFAFDDDQELAVQTRHEVLTAYGDRILACPHHPAAGFGRLEDGVWTPIG